MGNVWQLQEAKNKFSRLVEKARSDGPQIVTRHGKESVVIMAVEEYKNLRKTKSDLVTFLRSSPLSEAPLDLSRDKNSSREVDVL
ncbi:MAG: type II toxin-antitoxin system prevent-host-death family antitoxin [Deltaproteobacteria bacterium CG_4_8_14_3_um_filter_51_11]|nr:type II toxin-antitoxin system Phd/YefM family antitoxin [bacterium]OIP40323.1 MAG: prevent-host-death protein [Desulfobacteraceae bacterium CG2_30_51_40]PIP47825.1 MAG: type II toxin-antitoxin system prevent-host-death family antitoxin [Deltaproteobacteria bacterium CG23_combo_of_CG06-09_8_20_14_all_51_20]PIX20354.1 MAG: type II toxin-antitoxin system prevent-host-death family antitoxin [Deltaproteobacteria bacterium CG_4_8_14_3_um_filter_51_11]PIY24565.1 MAG: type II toxin-antitoxin system